MNELGAPSLRDLAIEFGTDKEGGHSYTRWYDLHFARFRSRPIRMLEIGVGGYADPLSGGASLRMWKAYFPLAEIVGLDIYDKSALAEDRIRIVQGDQGDPELLRRLSEDHGPFDIIVDDGSHRADHVTTSFYELFPRLSDGGIYAIEDLQTSYWRNDRARRGPNITGMDLLKRLADGLNHAEYDIANYRPTYLDEHVLAIHLYHNLAFIEKGDNTEPSNILPPHPRSRRWYAVRLARRSLRSVDARFLGDRLRRARDARRGQQ